MKKKTDGVVTDPETLESIIRIVYKFYFFPITLWNKGMKKETR